MEQNEVYSRPAAQFDEDGTLVVRASAAKGCRRMLWYTATGRERTNEPTDEALTVMEAGTALEPVVLKAMERASWVVDPSDPRRPREVSIQVGPNMKVTGHPDARAVPPAGSGQEVIVEVKTRGPSAYRRWETLGAERSHPESVAQLALYTFAAYDEPRDGVIATMDTGSRRWSYEVIPAKRLTAALEDACAWLGELGAHLILNGPDPDTPPERDFPADSWQCGGCPFLNTCLPGDGSDGHRIEVDLFGDPQPDDRVSRDDAEAAVRAYTVARNETKGQEQAKREALSTLKTWMRQQGLSKTTIEERKVSLVQSKRYSVDYRRLNAALDPEIRADIVKEQDSEYVRVA